MEFTDERTEDGVTRRSFTAQRRRRDRAGGDLGAGGRARARGRWC